MSASYALPPTYDSARSHVGHRIPNNPVVPEQSNLYTSANYLELTEQKPYDAALWKRIVHVEKYLYSLARENQELLAAQRHLLGVQETMQAHINLLMTVCSADHNGKFGAAAAAVKPSSTSSRGRPRSRSRKHMRSTSRSTGNWRKHPGKQSRRRRRSPSRTRSRSRSRRVHRHEYPCFTCRRPFSTQYDLHEHLKRSLHVICFSCRENGIHTGFGSTEELRRHKEMCRFAVKQET